MNFCLNQICICHERGFDLQEFYPISYYLAFNLKLKNTTTSKNEAPSTSSNEKCSHIDRAIMSTFDLNTFNFLNFAVFVLRP